MKQMVFEIMVGNMPAKKKRWWQFWRKKGDSAEESIADIISGYKEEIDCKHLDRASKISRMFGLIPTPMFAYQKEYWFPSPGVDASILRMMRIQKILQKK